MGAGQSELMVKARHLVNGKTVRVQEGGFVDYFQLLFDQHHIIYAEGIAAESMFVDPRTRAALPDDIRPAEPVDHGVDLNKSMLQKPGAIDRLRRASSG